MSNNPGIKFELVTPERVVFREEVLQASIPTQMGEITILPNHIPLVSILMSGVVELKKLDGSTEVLAISGGVLEVMTGKIVLLADTAELANDLDESRIEEAKAKAEKLREDAARSDKLDFTEVTAMLEKEMARSKAVKRWKKIKNIETIN